MTVGYRQPYVRRGNTAQRIALSRFQRNREHSGKWSDKRGSNPQPPAWEAGALPIELLSHEEKQESYCNWVPTQERRPCLFWRPSPCPVGAQSRFIWSW